MKNFGAQSMFTELITVLVKKPQSFMSKVNLKKWNYTYPLYQDLINQNYNEFINIIKKFGTKIIELKLENENDELCDSIFTHDPSIITNEGAIILSMGKDVRKPETLAHKSLYESLDIPIIGILENDATAEGGDCLWFNDRLLLIGKSKRTNAKGIIELTTILNKLNIEVIPIKLSITPNSDSCFHLMSIVSMLDHDLIIGYEKLLPLDLIKVLNKNDINLIKIPEDEFLKSKTLAVNILALSPRNLILLKGYPKTCELLSKVNCKLNLFYGDELCIKAEGGPTCLTRPILRK